MSGSDKNDSRSRILTAAEAVFAEKGFDGARVDVIAREAGVNKALIYYYFKSKDAILEELIRRFVEGTYPIKGEAVALLAPGVPDRAGEIVEAVYRYIDENRQIVSIMLMELLKETPRMKDILRYMNASAQVGREMLQQRGADVEVTGTTVGFMLFAEFIPMAVFSLIGRRWSDDAGVGFGDMKAAMSKHFTAVYQSMMKMNPVKGTEKD